MKISITSQLLISNIPKDFEKIVQAKLKFINPKWLENQRMRRWNKDTEQFLKFYEKSNNNLILPRGYARQLILLCRHYNINYELDDKRRVLEKINFNFSGQLKSFQQKAANIMLAKEFGTLSAPTGSGKTIISLYMIAKRQQPALIIVHTKDLAFQWIDKIESFLKIPENEIGLIGGGKKNIGKKISVALVQSLYKCTNEISPKIGYIIVDECHRAPSRTFTKAVSAFDAKYMLGLSATPWRRDKLSKLIFWYLGDVHYQIDKKELIKKGHILKPEVIFRETNFKPYYDPVKEYSKMLSELTADDERNNLIVCDVVNELKQNKGICLVLSDRKKHCETLESLLKYKYKLSTALLTGDMKTSCRKTVIDLINQEKVNVLVATGQLIGEGFDCKNLSSLFIATPVKFSGRLIQYLGRILRPGSDKSKARVYDYVDVHVGPLQAAAVSRHKTYFGTIN